MAPNEQAAALYRTWFGMLEQWARMFSPWLQPAANPFAAAPPGEDATAPAVPEPVKPIAEALNLTRQLLSQSYAVLGAAPPGQDWQGLAAANAGRLKAFFETGAAAQKQWLEGSARAMTEMGRAWSGGGQPFAFPGPWALLDVRSTHPLLDGLDRTFSALADAFGLGPSRALRDAWRELIAADVQRRKAQLDYFAVVAGAWSDVVDGVGIRLREMGARGERVESLVTLVRLWAGVAEKTLHEALQSKPGLDATAAYVRAALRYREQQNRVVDTLSGLLGVPTRTEVDDAYLEIQTLKRQVRELQREVRALSGAPAPKRRESKEKSRGEAR
jgi:hypothetical protein